MARWPAVLVLVFAACALPSAAHSTVVHCEHFVHGGFVASKIETHGFGAHGCPNAHKVIRHIIEHGTIGICYSTFRCTHTALADGGADWRLVQRHPPKATLTFTLHPHHG